MKILLWFLIGLAAVVALGVTAMFSRRAALRREFRAYLARKRPDLTVAQETGQALFLRGASGEDLGTLFLHRIYREAPQDVPGRHVLFDMLIATVSEGQALAHLGPDDRLRVMPRIVTASALAGMNKQPSADVPSTPLGLGDLSVVFVLDSKNSVAYLSGSQLAELGLDPAAALKVAKENLGRSFDSALVRSAVEKPNLNVVKALDTYDAARLLLVPELLKPGESLAAMIPDRDTLVLAQAPKDDNWDALTKLARNAAGDPLFRKPILVTSAGFSAAPR